MNTGMIPTRYATALLSFATEKKQEEILYEKAKIIVRNFAEQPKLHSALESPVLNFEIKKKLMLTAAGSATDIFFEKFIQLLLTNNRETFLHLIMLKYIDLYRIKNNIYSGKLITASKIDALTEKKLTSVIESQKKGKLEIHKSVDPELIGGFILEVDNTRWDASIKRQLQTIKNEFAL